MKIDRKEEDEEDDEEEEISLFLSPPSVSLSTELYQFLSLGRFGLLEGEKLIVK